MSGNLSDCHSSVRFWGVGMSVVDSPFGRVLGLPIALCKVPAYVMTLLFAKKILMPFDLFDFCLGKLHGFDSVFQVL